MAVLTLALAGTVTTGMPAEASEIFVPRNWQNRTAINDPANESTVGDAWDAKRYVDSTSGAGAHLQLTPGATYELTASGKFSYHKGVGEARMADAECTIDATVKGGSLWRARRWEPLYPSAGEGLIDVVAAETVDGATKITDLTWVPAVPRTADTGDAACSADHRYTVQFTPTVRDVFLRVHDGNRSDNLGGLTITARGPGPQIPQWFQCPKWTEDPIAGTGGTIGEIQSASLTLDSRRDPYRFPVVGALDDLGDHILPHWRESGHWGMYTCNWAMPGSRYLIEVQGSYQFSHVNDPGAVADAECSQLSSDPNLEHHRWVDPNPPLRDFLDLYVNYEAVEWVAMGRLDPDNPNCSLDNTYCIIFSPTYTGPLHFRFYDNYAEQDNVGSVEIKVTRLPSA